jgi:hypothetical protein
LYDEVALEEEVIDKVFKNTKLNLNHPLSAPGPELFGFNKRDGGCCGKNNNNNCLIF